MVKLLTDKHLSQMINQVQILGRHSDQFISQSAKYHYELTKAIAFQDLDPRSFNAGEKSATGVAAKPNLEQNQLH